ncbi:MAG TPA: GNAT family N-acetyltransferase [Iamia sp.]|nr:GNAT family N-acetyltransferase [Iamia sp.]
MSIEVTDHDEAGRYEVRVDGELAGFADRTVRDGLMVLPHTVVDRRFRGRGLAAELVRRALDDARAGGLKVVPSCWYVAQYIDEHPADQDLLAR